MAVTFGCPLVGPYSELCGKHLKVGQRAYATDGAAISNGKESGKSYTNWKTGAVDKNGNLIVYDNLPWDTNMGGDTDSIGSNIFIVTCDIDVALNVSNISATYEKIKKAYEEDKIVIAIGTIWNGDKYILNLVALQDEVIIFNGVCNNQLLTFFLQSDNSDVYIKTIQTVENLIQSMDGNENVIDCYPSAKAVADYVANHSGSDNVDLSNYFTKDEATRMIDFQIQNVYDAINSEVKIIDKEKEDILNKVDNFDDPNHETYPDTQAVWDLVQEEFGSLLDRIMALEAKLTE